MSGFALKRCLEAKGCPSVTKKEKWEAEIEDDGRRFERALRDFIYMSQNSFRLCWLLAHSFNADLTLAWSHEKPNEIFSRTCEPTTYLKTTASGDKKSLDFETFPAADKKFVPSLKTFSLNDRTYGESRRKYS